MAGTTKGRDVTTNGKADTIQNRADLTPTMQWRKQSKEGLEYRLPGSGNVVKLVRPGLQGMVTRAGHVPNPLSREVRQFLAKMGELRTDEIDDESRDKLLLEHADAKVQLAKMCLIFPQLITDGEPNYEAGQIAPEDIPDFDYNWFVYTFIEGDAARLAEFRVNIGVGEVGFSSGTVQENTNGVLIP